MTSLHTGPSVPWRDHSCPVHELHLQERDQQLQDEARGFSHRRGGERALQLRGAHGGLRRGHGDLRGEEEERDPGAFFLHPSFPFLPSALGLPKFFSLPKFCLEGVEGLPGLPG